MNTLANFSFLQKGNAEFYMSFDGLRVIESGIDKPWEDVDVLTLEAVRYELDNDSEALAAIESMGFTTEADKLKKFVECRYGDLSHNADIIAGDCSDNEEYYPCSHRGNCKHEGKICKPIHVRYGKLSPRELEVSKHVAAGMSDKQIAETMFLSVLTINSHIKNIIQKTGLHCRAAIAAFAVSRNIASFF